MKKLFAFILALVYFFATAPAVYSLGNCEGDSEELYIKAEDHHRASGSYVKLEPVSPVIKTRVSCPEQVLAAPERTFYETPVLSDAVPLFVRHCHFRI